VKFVYKIFLPALMLAFGAPLFAQSVGAELSFYKKESISDDKKQLGAIVDALHAWSARNYALPGADDALFLKGDLEVRPKAYTPAAVTLLRHLHEFPKSKNADAARVLLSTVAQNIEKKKRDNFSKLIYSSDLRDSTADRIAEFLTVFTNLELKGSFAPLYLEFESFFARFPVYENKDKIELLLGDLYRQNENYQAAIMQYRKVYDIYPSSKYKAASLRMIGDVYADNLKDYSQAMFYYESVLKEFPQSVERGVTYHHMAILAESRKDYTKAISSIAEAINIYMKDSQYNKAYEALHYKADMQENRIKDYNAAIDTLNETAEAFARDQRKFTDTKFKIAGIYGKKLKDPYGQVNAYEDVIIKYPADSKAPEAFYQAASLSEKEGNRDKAKNLYQRLIVDHPADALATKAQRRVNAIDKQISKEEAAGAPASALQATTSAATGL
jgi:TolA-binding protein